MPLGTPPRTPWSKTMMPNPYLPQETLDYIVDLLHDEPETLRECCLLSKPWIPRTRKHLFADIKFRSAHELELWKKTFPDHSSFPIIPTPCWSITLRSPSQLEKRVVGFGHFLTLGSSSWWAAAAYWHASTTRSPSPRSTNSHPSSNLSMCLTPPSELPRFMA